MTSIDQPVALGGLILAGGQGQRLGGCDKGLLVYQGEPYVAHLVHCLGPVVSALAISANGVPDRYQRWGRVLPDTRFPGQGPLAGLWEGLHWAREQGLAGVLVATCDTPALAPEWAAAMARQAQSAPETPCISALNQGQDWQPLHGYYPVGVLSQVGEHLQSGRLRARGLAQALGAEILDADAWANGFHNVNTPQDQSGLEDCH